MSPAALAAQLGARARISLTPSSAFTPLRQALTLFHPHALWQWLGWSGVRRLVGRSEATRPAPVVVSPPSGVTGSPQELAALLREELPAFRASMLISGALLFRGWGLQHNDHFDTALEALRSRPTDFFGTAPRCRLDSSRYLFRNVAFESAGAGDPGRLQRLFKLVWGSTNASSKSHLQLFNFHNELAYLTPQRHTAPIGAFACADAPQIGGSTLLADCRRVLESLEHQMGVDGLPVAFKYTIARKPKDGVVQPRQTSGDYEGFLLGEYELDGVADQWATGIDSSSGGSDESGTGSGTGREVALRERAASLGLEVIDEGDDLAIWSSWIPTIRHHDITKEQTWWLNGNHMTLGACGHPKLPFLFRFDNGVERAPTWEEAVIISTAFWRESSFFAWERGDLLLFDNQLVAHNASPGVGSRRILPSFGAAF